MLLKIGSTNVTQNWFHNYYSKLVPQTSLMYLCICMYACMYVFMLCMYVTYVRCCLKFIPQTLFKLAPQLLLKVDLQMLLKIYSTNVIQTGSIGVTQNLFHKRYLKLVPQVLPKIDPQTLLKIGSTSGTKFKNVFACDFFYRLKCKKLHNQNFR